MKPTLASVATTHGLSTEKLQQIFAYFALSAKENIPLRWDIFPEVWRKHEELRHMVQFESSLGQ